MELRFRVHLDFNFADVGEVIEDAMTQLGGQASSWVQGFTPVVTGALKGAWTMEGEGTTTLSLVNNLPYASVIDIGSRFDGTYALKTKPGGYRMAEQTIALIVTQGQEFLEEYIKKNIIK